MTYKNVIKISAMGTSGKVRGIEFLATPTPDGKFILNKKVKADKSISDGNKTNKAINKVLVDTLTDAANLLVTDDYLINVTCKIPLDDKTLGKFKTQRALRDYKKVTITEA